MQENLNSAPVPRRRKRGGQPKQAGQRYSQRDLALEGIRVCGLNDDRPLANTISARFRVSRREFDEHFGLGQRQRAEAERSKTTEKP
jgi:hypothetical protein